MVDEDPPQGRRRGVIKDRPVGSACSILAGADEARLVPVVHHSEKLKILKEITGKQRDRLYTYDRYMRILDVGTEPLRRPAH